VTTAVVLFTRDLRVHDNPALAAAVRENERVLPLFVLDDAFSASRASRRHGFLAGCLHDLSDALGGLAVRRGESVRETVKLARDVDAHVVHMADDASAFAQQRIRRLSTELEVRIHPSTSVVPLDALRTTAGGAYRVFTPYWRVWRSFARRSLESASPRVRLPEGVELGALPKCPPEPRWPGGELSGRLMLRRFLSDGLARYGEAASELAPDASSRLSPHLHFGSLSPLEVAVRTEGNERFLRQLCWRDFYLQLLAAHPRLAREDLRRGPVEWRHDPEALSAWRAGETGVPIVDAAMRQLHDEGWLPNRARLIVASFLTKTLRIHWRAGADHFAEQLIDGDLASNTGNWQWIAGTGTDTRPNRRLNPERQASRHDPEGEYVRTHARPRTQPRAASGCGAGESGGCS
jgi:deoxyribodipyrimidine photo-lyase